jgi:hypothetical protein
MKLVFDDTPPWPVGKMTAGTLPPATESGIFVTPLNELMDHWLPWQRKAIGWAVPADAKVEVISETKTQSTLEWPAIVIESVISVAEVPVEARLTVLYFFMEWCAVVVFRTPPAQLAAERERAMTAILGARPDWTTPSALSLSQLYQE